jgi:hypothetical protein
MEFGGSVIAMDKPSVKSFDCIAINNSFSAAVNQRLAGAMQPSIIIYRRTRAAKIQCYFTRCEKPSL